MCEFVSWLEVYTTEPGNQPEIFWLTDSKLGDTSLTDVPNKDLIGHGAVKKYYGLIGKKCVERETPHALPQPIITDFRAGKMDRMMAIGGYRQFCINDKGLLDRADGPAMELSDGTKYWYSKDHLHREDGPAVEWPDGTKKWYINNRLHRKDGPAVEWSNGSKEWYINGYLHRENGPALERPDGTKKWYINNRLHRKDGPAVEWSSGSKEWYINGYLHRENGPALERSNGTKKWYINGILMAQNRGE